MKEKHFLSNYLRATKSAFESSGRKEEFSRRLEWAVTLSEECYQDELSRFNHINSLVSSLLVASSFLTAAIVEFFVGKNGAEMGTALKVFLVISGSLMVFSILCQLALLFYRKRIRGKSVCDVATTYLDIETKTFENPYSENYGRLLTLDELFESIKKANNTSAKIEIVAVTALVLSLIAFFLCFFLK